MIGNYSKVLFWDVDFNTVSLQQHADFIIRRVCMLGTWDDWLQLKKDFGIEKIKQALLNARYLDKKTLNYFSIMYKIPKDKFRCYNLQQSGNQHWNY
jgi:hypothetical protein